MEELNCEQKLAKVMIKLRSIRPFYSALYESLEKREMSVETMGVGTNTLYYNKEFVEKLSFSELVFVNLHEIFHIALMHVARRQNRDSLLWNLACDLYVNKSLMDEFGILPGKTAQIGNYTEITVPENGVFCTSIDLNKDYAEKIYDEFEKQARSNGYFSKNPGKYEFNYIGSDKKNYYFGYNKYVEKYDEFHTEINVIDSENILSSFDIDLKDKGLDQNQKEQQSRKIISDAVIRSEMSGYNVGSGTSNIEIQVKEFLRSKLNWKKLFKKYLIQVTSSDSSFLIPDKRMYYQSAIYPGLISEESNSLNGVKICIDTSGSISTEDMSRFFYQVYSILKTFKVNAELIYWDAEVKSAGNISNITEFERVSCFGGGGTNPAVVFERFKQRKENPSVILMLTDGFYFDDWSKELNKRKYKDTIWIMTKDYNVDFSPPFGKLAIAEFIE